MNRFLLIGCLFFLSDQLLGQDTLRFTDVVARARLHVPEVYQAKAALEEAGWNWQAYQAGLLPQLSLSGTLPNYSRTFSPVVQPDGNLQFRPVANQSSNLSLEMSQQIGLTGGTFLVNTQLQRFDDFENTFTQYSSSPFTIGYRQTLFGFNAQRWNRKLEPMRLTAAERSFLSKREASALTAAKVYFEVLLAQLDLEMAQQNAHYGEKMLEIAQLRYSLGKLSENDLLQLEYNLMSARQRLLTARQVQEASSGSLAVFLGTDGVTSTLWVDNPPEPPRYSVALHTAREQAFQNRETLVELEISLLEAQRQQQKVKRENGFSAELYAALGLADRADNFSEVYQHPVNQQFVSLGLSVPILDWGRARARSRAAGAALQATELNIAQEKAQFALDIAVEVGRYQRMQQQLELSEKAAQVAEKRYSIARESFALGRISITELNLAQLEKDNAQRAYIQSLRDAWLSHLQLRYLTLYDFETNRPIGLDTE